MVGANFENDTGGVAAVSNESDGFRWFNSVRNASFWKSIHSEGSILSGRNFTAVAVAAGPSVTVHNIAASAGLLPWGVSQLGVFVRGATTA